MTRRLTGWGLLALFALGQPACEGDDGGRPDADDGLEGVVEGGDADADAEGDPGEAETAAAGITVDPPGGLVTTEGGASDTFTVVLDAEPAADVTIALSSSDPSEGTVEPAALTFTPLDWNAPQTVTVTGVDDDVIDGDQPYTIVTAPAASADAAYDGIDAADVAVSNTDDETAGITVDPTEGLVTTEAGGTDVFTVVLNAEPTADVTVALSSDDESEGTVDPPSLTFTPLDWNAPQTVTVTGVDDDVIDGDQPYTIVTAPAASADAAYDGIDAPDVSVSNADDETPGITVAPTSGLVTTESGGTAEFTIVLDSEPSDDVTMPVSSTDAGEGYAEPATVTFTPLNWDAPRTVTVVGVDDAIADGNQPYSIAVGGATSSDPNYSGLNPPDVSVTNTDNDSAGITVTPTSGLTTTESGGAAAFTIVLNSQPTADVAVTLSSGDGTEGTIDPSSIVFTPLNWNAARVVTVVGVDDPIADGNQVYTVAVAAAVSGDPAYDGLNPPDVSVTNLDDDTAGYVVSPTLGLFTSEAGGTAIFVVSLLSQPAADVTVSFASSDASEGTVDPPSVVLTPLDWSVLRTVTVTGVDDSIADGNQTYAVLTEAASADAAYAALNPPDVSVTNTDNDSAGVTVVPMAGLVTTEAGGSATFTVVLNSLPAADVTVGLSTGDASEGTVRPASLTFGPADWDTPRTATVTGQDDRIADGNQLYAIVTAPATSADPAYAGIDPANVSVMNNDDDTAGFTVVPTMGLVTTEAGGTATFTIVLTSEPVADVMVSFTSSDASEVLVAPSSTIFTSTGWGTPATVTLTGVDDAIIDGDQAVAVVTSAAASTDPGYNGLDPVDVGGTNRDDDALPERLSVDSAGAQGGALSQYPAVSADGRWAVFASNATNLVAGDTNGATDVFLRDRSTGTTTRLSVDSAGAQANGASTWPVISADGHYVAFFSAATNLVAGDTNGAQDVFVRDTTTNATTRASVGPAGAQGNGASINPAISSDGRWVAFQSDASNLVTGDTNRVRDVFLHDRSTGATIRVSVDSAGAQGNGASSAAVVSADGRYVLFASDATNLVLRDTNLRTDVFLRDTSGGGTTRISVSSAGAEGNGASLPGGISADGRYVAFQSDATNLVSGDTNGTTDVLLRDRTAGATTRISIDTGGGNPNGASSAPTITEDGRYVAYQSAASDLVAGDTNGAADVFVRDRTGGTTVRASVDRAGAQVNGASSAARVAPRGRFVVFHSVATNLVAGDTNGVQDAFIAAVP